MNLTSTASTTVRDLIDALATSQPNGTYLFCAKSGRQLSFKQVQCCAVNIGAEFSRIGLRGGDKVAFMLDNSVTAAELFLGSMYCGFVATPLNVRAGVSQIAYMLEHSDSKVVYLEEKYQDLFDGALAEVKRPILSIRLRPENSPWRNAKPFEWDPSFVPRPQDPAMLMYSSGTTGQPKGAIHTHGSILAHGRNSILAHELTAEDRSLLVLPLYHINAECVTLIPTLMSGGSVVVADGFRVNEFWDWLDDYRCTWSALVPTIISQLLDWKDPKAASRAAAFRRIRFLRVSSAPLSPALHREFLDKFDLPLLQAMGSSEAGNIFSNPAPPGVNKIGSPGLPWGFELRIVGRDGEDLPSGQPGEMLIRGDGMMQAYYKDPAGTAAALDADRWLHTGDLAYRDEDGYVFVVGRSKELIIKGGMNIAPKQIDEVLESHPSVLEAAAVGVPDRYVGEEIVAFAVLREQAKCDESELLTFCESRLGHFKTPARIHFVGDLPKGPSGKVQRLKLQEEAASQSVAPPASEALEKLSAKKEATTSPGWIEDIIGEAWARLLKLPSVHSESNFFSLGGHSLLAIQCLAQLRDKLPVRMSLADFFENATVAGQAALIQRRLETASASAAAETWRSDLAKAAPSPTTEMTIPLRDRSLPCPLSPNQKRIWFMQQAIGEAPVYNEVEAARLSGDLDVGALEKALNVIVAHRENLRCSIREIGEEPIAFVHDGWRLQLEHINLSSLALRQREAEVARLLSELPRRPYRLEAEPAIRAALIRLGPSEHVLVLMMHHIICDWASLGNFWRDLAALYRAGRRGQPLDLPDLPIEHGDYAAWQRHESRQAEIAADLNYWKEQLRGAPALLELPSDRPRPSVLSFRGAKRRFLISAQLTKAIRDCARREKVSMFTFFAAAVSVLLYRYTGEEDILLGVPLSDRDLPEVQAIIGFLLHTHALRTRPGANLRFRELLNSVQKDSLDLYVHRSPPFDQVVNAVHPSRSASHSPLFQVMLNWRDRDQLLSFIGLEGLEIESVLADNQTSKFDLTFMLTDGDESIDAEIEYSVDLFDEDRIVRMFGHLETLLEAAAADPEGRLAELPLLTHAERHELLAWNWTESAYPKDLCVHQLFERQATATPDAVAAIFDNESISYRDLNDRAERLARVLRDRGAGPDQRIAICLERSLDLLTGLVAILKSGAAYVPLDPTYPRERLDYMLADSSAILILTEERLRSRFETDNIELRIVCADSKDLWADESNDAPRLTANSENLAYVIYTSGSTGQPKGVEVSHRSVVNLLCAMQKELEFGASDKLFAVTTISFDIAGLELLMPLISGGQVAIAPTHELRDGVALRQRLERSHATVMQATPATWAMLIESGWAGDPNLRVLCGGEAIAASLAESLATRVGRVWNVYGPTEATIWSSFDRIEPGKPITIGRPLANTQFHVVESRGQLVPVGAPGELFIGGDGLARGYLGRPQLTAEKFIAGSIAIGGQRLYRTGDLVRRLADGRLQWLARLDNQVKVRGFRIELGEIESALATHPTVQEAVALVHRDERGDQQLLAYVTAKEGVRVDAAQLRAHLHAKLPGYMAPNGIFVVGCFPLTPNGKVDRKALPRAVDELAERRNFTAPLTGAEKTLAEIWRRALGREHVGLGENFFDLGGHSLLAIRVITEINQAMRARVTVPQFFQNPTIEQLAQSLAPASSRPLKPKVFVLREGSGRPSLYFIGAGPVEIRIAKFIGGTRAVFGTDAPLPVAWRRAFKSEDRAEWPTLGQLGSLHGEAVRAHAGSSPCVLAGYSFQGKVVIEAARALQKAGGTVAAVLLVDASAWGGTAQGMKEILRRNIRRVRGLGAKDAELKTAVAVPPSVPLSHLIRTASWLLSRVPPEIKRRTLGQLDSKDNYFERKDVNGWVDEDGMPVTLADVRRIFSRLGQTFDSRPLDAAAVLFRTPHPGDKFLLGEDFDNGWSGRFSGGLEIVPSRGDHWSLVRDEQNAMALARQMDEVLGRFDYPQELTDALKDRAYTSVRSSAPKRSAVSAR